MSWLTILKKREAFRRAFDNFQPDVIVQYGPEKVEALMADAGIVRNRRKIEPRFVMPGYISPFRGRLAPLTATFGLSQAGKSS